MSLRLVYIAGPYSASTRAGVEENIDRAVLHAIVVAKLGAMPVCPHANTAHPEFADSQPYTFWIDGTLELLRRCDAVFFIPGWDKSAGARGEWKEAVARCMPVFESLVELKVWLEKSKESAA